MSRPVDENGIPVELGVEPKDNLSWINEPPTPFEQWFNSTHRTADTMLMNECERVWLAAVDFIQAKVDELENESGNLVDHMSDTDLAGERGYDGDV